MVAWDQSRIIKAATLVFLAFAICILLFVSAMSTLADATMQLFNPTGPSAPIGMNIIPCIMTLVLAVIFVYTALSLRAGMQIEVKLDKPQYLLGEPITGTVTLNLSKEKAARSLTAIFAGYQKRGKHTRVVCKTESLLSPARTYRKGEVLQFSIPIPAEVKNYVDPPAPANELESFGRTFTFAPQWHVMAKLDVPGEVDIEHYAPVAIVSGKEPVAPPVQAGQSTL